LALDLSRAFNPVDSPSELDNGDYIVAVTDNGLYGDYLSDREVNTSFESLYLRDGILKPEHTYLRVYDLSEPDPGVTRPNDVEELYLVPEDVAPEEAFHVDSLKAAAEVLEK
jgi:hypothetical protein